MNINKITILNEEVPNFKYMKKSEQDVYLKIYDALENKKFDPEILTEDIFKNKRILLVAMLINSPHLNSFTCKINDPVSYMKAARTKHIEDFKYFDDEFFEDHRCIENVLLLKPKMFSKLPISVKEDYNIFKFYLKKVSHLDWNDFPVKYQIREYGLISIEKNLENVPFVIKKFPGLKRSKHLWNSIATYFIRESINPIPDILKDKEKQDFLDLSIIVSNLLAEKDEQMLLKKIKEINQLFITPKMLVLLSSGETFKKYLKNVDIQSLDENENQLPLLRNEVIKFVLTEMDKDNIKEVRNKPKI